MWTQKQLQQLLNHTPQNATIYIVLFDGNKLPLTEQSIEESAMYAHIQIDANKSTTHHYVMYEQISRVEIITSKDVEPE